MKPVLVVLYALCLTTLNAQDLASTDSLLSWDLSEVTVVSNKRQIKSSALAERVHVLDEKDIERTSSQRLNEILQQVNGVFIDAAFGEGVQMQGLDADYTMILIDGVPLVGRKGGVLDLERIALLNIKHIEVLKGPYSTLYGSEALAGIINIITEEPKGSSIFFETGLRSTEIYDVAGGIQSQLGKFSYNVNGGFRSRSGYAILPDQQGYTLPPSSQVFLNSNFVLKGNNGSRLKMDVRWLGEQQDEAYSFNGQNVEGDTKVKDLSIRLTDHRVVNDKWGLQNILFVQRYDQKQSIWEAETKNHVDQDDFNHIQVRGQSEATYYAANGSKLTLGAGILYNQVETNRYRNSQDEWNIYGYGQLKKPFSIFDLIAGFRVEHNDLSGLATTGTVALSKEWTDRWVTSLSVGSGYKLPDYRQKYLSYTNATVGYSIVGTEALYFYDQLRANGEIQSEFENPHNHDALKPEYSWSFSGDIMYKPNARWQLKLNLYRNELRDMIETYAFALKQNGLFVYSYKNLDEIYTQGIEVSGSGRIKRWDISLGYALLDAKDRSVLKEIESGSVFGRDPSNNAVYRLDKSDYGGLFNRSKHSGQFKLAYGIPKYKIEVFSQLFYRGRFGRYDIDGNNILNRSDEYVDGYLALNLGVRKSWSNMSMSIGVDNIGNYADALNLPTLRGRTGWIKFKTNFQTKKVR